MAGKPLIFTNALIATDSGFSVNTSTISLTDDENITIGNEPVEVLVEGGETIKNAFDQEISIISYDVDSLSETNFTNAVSTNASTIVDPAYIRLQGATGSVNVTISDVRISASRPFNDGLTRDHIMIKATIRSTTGITVADV